MCGCVTCDEEDEVVFQFVRSSVHNSTLHLTDLKPLCSKHCFSILQVQNTSRDPQRGKQQKHVNYVQKHWLKLCSWSCVPPLTLVQVFFLIREQLYAHNLLDCGSYP